MIEMSLVSLIINIGPGEHRVPVGLSTDNPGRVHGRPGGCI